MANMVLGVLALAFFCWAMYSGWNWVSGRYEILERQTILSKVLKIVVVIVIGWVIGAIYLLKLAFKLAIWLVSGGPFK